MTPVRRLARTTFETRNGTQVSVDGDELPLSHVLERRPRHHLKHIAVERWQQALRRVARAVRMSVIGIDTGAKDAQEVSQASSTFGQSRLVRGQVTRNDVHAA